MREIKFRAFSKNYNKMHEDVTYRDESATDSDPWEYMQFTGLLDKNGKEIYESDIVAFIDRDVFHFVERKDSKPAEGIWIDKKEELNKTPSFEEKVIRGRRCLVVEWQNNLTGYYPFADAPDNCGHCGGGYSAKSFEVIGNIYEDKHLLDK